MKRILFCTDGSAYAQVCGQYAAWLAGRTPCAFEVLYVTDARQFEIPLVADLGGGLGVQPYQSVMARLQELEQDKAQLLLENAGRQFATALPGAPVTLTHRTGLLVDCFQEFEAGTDLVMLGKRGENANFATGHLGSTMERVVRASHRPCFVTSRSYRAIRRVLLAFDGSRSSRLALRHLAEGPVFQGLETHVVIVAARTGEENALGVLREAEAALRAAGAAPVCQMLHGAPEDEIAAYVEARDIDCLLMGAYGHSRIRHLMIGSTTSALLRECRVPVLLFR